MQSKHQKALHSYEKRKMSRSSILSRGYAHTPKEILLRSVMKEQAPVLMKIGNIQ